MTEDDPRHGESRGYNAGCRAACCKTAAAAYRRGLRSRIYLARVDGLHTNGAGTRRRIQALMALGWSTRELDKLIDRKPSYTYRLLSAEGDVYLSTAALFRDLYNRLSMTRPPVVTADQQRMVTRTVRLAARLGYVVPLAWDDIDNDLSPRGQRHDYGADYDSNDLVDETTVDRILAGEVLRTNRAEKAEVMRRWLAAGQSERSLCIRMGWKDGRYVSREAGAA